MKRGHVGAFRGGRSIKRSAGGTVVAAQGSGVTLSTVTPASGIPGDSVVITGTGFAGGQSVFVCGASAAGGVTVDSSTQLTVIVPSGSRGLGDVTVADATLTNAFTAPVFFDDFSSGAKASSHGGCSWVDGTGYTQASVIAANPYGGRTYSLQYPYTPTGYVEQRFTYPAVYEVWIEQPVLIPSNYNHIDTANDNNKFILFGVNDTGRKLNFETYSQGDGSSYLLPQFTHGDSASIENVRTNPGGKTGSTITLPDFIKPTTGVIKPGTYAVVRVQIRTTTAYGANDGTMQLWVDGSQVLAKQDDLDLWTAGTTGGSRPTFSSGYLWGADNSNPGENTTYNQGYFALFTDDPGW